MNKMIPSSFRSATLALLLGVMLGALPAFAGTHYTRMVMSKPVVENGLEFVAATEDEWVCFNSPYGADPIQVQLFIRNVSGKQLLFSTFDTFSVMLREQSGRVIMRGGGRDATLRTKSVFIDPGATYCLSRKAELRWNQDGKTRTFIYYDGTGTVATYSPLADNSYTLSFWCGYRETSRPTDDDAHFTRWTGQTETKQVTFKIGDP